MKKSLLALAVLGGFAATASAGTDVYGIVDIGVGYTTQGGKSTVSVDSGHAAASRLGFKGGEDIGGGLKAVYKAEIGFNVDNGTQAGGNAKFFNREVLLGLESGAGAVHLGRLDTLLFSNLIALDPFGTVTNGKIVSHFNAGGLRLDNALRVKTAGFGPVKADFLYGFGEKAGDASEGRVFSTALTYSAGPVDARFVIHSKDQSIGKDVTTLVGGSYNFGAAKAFVSHQTNKNKVAGNIDNNDLMVGVSAPLGKGTVLASYIKHDDKRVADVDSKKHSVGYGYNLSKKTSVHTSYAHTKTDNVASTNALSFSVKHAF